MQEQISNSLVWNGVRAVIHPSRLAGEFSVRQDRSHLKYTERGSGLSHVLFRHILDVFKTNLCSSLCKHRPDVVMIPLREKNTIFHNIPLSEVIDPNIGVIFQGES